jgi:hypothetical protein
MRLVLSILLFWRVQPDQYGATLLNFLETLCRCKVIRCVTSILVPSPLPDPSISVVYEPRFVFPRNFNGEEALLREADILFENCLTALQGDLFDREIPCTIENALKNLLAQIFLP